MPRCEDFPCCGHEAGCCPDFDPETGKQLNMRCTCGAKLPVNNRSSICNTCLRHAAHEDGERDGDFLSDGFDEAEQRDRDEMSDSYLDCENDEPDNDPFIEETGGFSDE